MCLMLVVLFQGPSHIFCASHLWTAPRIVHLTKDPKQGYGFSIRGDAPVRVNKVEPSTNAEVGFLFSFFTFFFPQLLDLLHLKKKIVWK